MATYNEIMNAVDRSVKEYNEEAKFMSGVFGELAEAFAEYLQVPRDRLRTQKLSEERPRYDQLIYRDYFLTLAVSGYWYAELGFELRTNTPIYLVVGMFPGDNSITFVHPALGNAEPVLIDVPSDAITAENLRPFFDAMTDELLADIKDPSKAITERENWRGHNVRSAMLRP